MVAGRVHLRLGQGRDAILGPRPSLLETSILPPSPTLGYLPSTLGLGLGVPSPPSPPAGHTCSCAAADSRAQSLHSAMTLGVQGPAAGLFFRFCMQLGASYYSTAFFFARPSPLPFNVSGSIDRTVVTLTQAEAVFTGTVLSCEAAAGARLS